MSLGVDFLLECEGERSVHSWEYQLVGARERSSASRHRLSRHLDIRETPKLLFDDLANNVLDAPSTKHEPTTCWLSTSISDRNACGPNGC